MADELDPNKKGEGQPGATGPAQTGPDPKPSDEEVKKAQLQKDIAELEAAKVAANAELQRVRDLKKAEKKKPTAVPAPEAEEEKEIDLNDPDSKAWDKHIRQAVSPVAEELEKEKAEIRSFAISKFLETKPSLAKNPEKLKELMQVYERSHTASERTVEGVLVDLEKSYAYTHSNELLEAARQSRVEDARKNAIFADIGVSRGSTGYTAPQETTRVYTDDEKAILAKWGQSAAFPKIEEKTSKV